MLWYCNKLLQNFVMLVAASLMSAIGLHEVTWQLMNAIGWGRHVPGCFALEQVAL